MKKLNLNFPRGDIDYLVLMLDIQINTMKMFPKQSKTNLIFLAYLHKYGYDIAKEKLLEDEMLLNIISFVNATYKMRKAGILVGKQYIRFKDEKIEIHPSIILDENIKLNISTNNLIKNKVLYEES